jgi:ADP-heptose:LPS heptosyltransferase
VIFILLAIALAPIFRRRVVAKPSRILVVQVAKIGDFVCTTPLIRMLKRTFPDAKITVVTSPVVTELAAQLPFIDATIASPSNSTRGMSGKLKWVGALRKHNFDMVFCCNGGTAWPGILALAGIPVRIGLTPNFLGTSTALAQRLWTARAVHDGDQLIGVTYAKMAALAGVTDFDAKYEIHARKGAGEKVRELLGKTSENCLRIGIAVSSANKLKELGAALITEICRGLLARFPDATIVFLGTREDQPEARRISECLSNFPLDQLVNSCGLLSLSEVPALLSELNVFVGVDSGLTYIADSLGVPLVSIAGPCNMRETRPVNNSSVIIQHDLPCSPCAHIFRAPYNCRLGTRACIKEITADEVIAEVIRLCPETSWSDFV